MQQVNQSREEYKTTANSPCSTTYNEIVEDTPITKTTTTTQSRLLGENYPYKYVLSYTVRVRSMGTCTYIALGSYYGQEARLTVAGQTYSYSCNRYEVIDLTKKYIVADQADGVLEVSCSFLPMSQYGKVKRVQ